MTTKKWPPNHNGHVKINLSKVTRGFFYDCPKWGLLYSNFRLAKPFFLLMKLDYNHNKFSKISYCNIKGKVRAQKGTSYLDLKMVFQVTIPIRTCLGF